VVECGRIEANDVEILTKMVFVTGHTGVVYGSVEADSPFDSCSNRVVAAEAFRFVDAVASNGVT
jgi:hypothetical protein